MPILNSTVRRVAEKTGKRTDELLDLVDIAKEPSIERAEKLLLRSGTLLKIASSERFMGFVSRLLDLSFAKRAAEAALVWYLTRAATRAQSAENRSVIGGGM